MIVQSEGYARCVKNIVRDMYFSIQERLLGNSKIEIAILESKPSHISSEVRSGFTYELGLRGEGIHPFYTSYNAHGSKQNMYEIIHGVLSEQYHLIVVIGNDFVRIVQQITMLQEVAVPILFSHTSPFTQQETKDSDSTEVTFTINASSMKCL